MHAWAEDPSLVWRTRKLNRYGAAERSQDAGMTWQQQGTWPDAVFAVHVHPMDPDRGMHSFSYLNNGTEVLGVRTTVDGGHSWSEHDHGRSYVALVADPADADGDSVWMASHTNGLYHSADFGKTWKKKTSPEASAVLHTGAGTGTGRLLIGGDTIRYSDDGGTTFHAARIEHISDPLRVVAFAQHDGILYAATASIWYPGEHSVIPAGHGVLRSRDNGRTWHDASGNLPTLDVRALAVDPAGRCLYAGLQGGSVHRLAL